MMNENNQPLITGRMIWFAGAVVLMMYGIAAWAWGRVEPPIPVHWDIGGNPDQFGGKFKGLLAPVLVTDIMLATILIWPFIAPRRENLERSRKAYRIFFYSMTLFMFIYYAMMVRAMLTDGRMDNLVELMVGILCIVSGNYMSTIRSNYFFGIRTPWTLNSEYSWRKTHLIGGRMYIVLGVLYVAAGLFGVSNLVGGVLVTLILGMSAFLVAYSYVTWRNDPERITERITVETDI